MAILEILLERRISGVFVVDAGKVVGSVGEGELLHRHEIGTQESLAPKNWWWRFVAAGSQSPAYVKTHGEYARDFMDPEVVSVSEDTPIAAVASIFDARQIRRVPVLRGVRSSASLPGPTSSEHLPAGRRPLSPYRRPRTKPYAFDCWMS